MKKSLLSTFIGITLVAGAQIRESNISSKPYPLSSQKKVSYSQTHGVPSLKKVSAISSQWYNFVDFLELVNPGVAQGNYMNIFPDSTIVLGLDAQNNPVYPYIHKAGQYLDPSFFGYTNIANKSTTYTLDSLYIGYSYLRKSASSVTDSIIIQIIAENQLLNYNTGSPGFPYQDIEYDPTTNNVKPSTPVLKRISIPLTEADSSSNYNRIYVPVVGVPAQTNSKKIGTVISFKPGYSYSFNDTLLEGNTPVNAFFLVSFEQNGDNTDPTYFGTPNDFTSNMNMSMLLPTDCRYDINSNGWNGFFIPTYAYTTPFSYETHDIGYLLSVADVGLEELSSKGFSMSQNCPNPFSGSTVVNFELAKNAKDVIFSIKDVTGRLIATHNVENTIGKHSITISNLSTGVYYYSLNVDGISTIKKMIIE